MRGVLCVIAALSIPLACNKGGSPSPTGATSASASSSTSAFAVASTSTSASTAVPGLALPSASVVDPVASASASTSASALSPLASRVVGVWTFARFDLTDVATNTKWKAIPEDVQKQILEEAPKASIEFTPTQIVSRLSGVPDHKSAWSVESETATELTIKSGDGRKKLRFVDDLLRVEELDKKDQFVSLFARKVKLALPPTPSAGAK